jgi:EAL domain-containing protein (putative c-di-GMP-specific phosphodiesterase class I)
VHEAGRDRAIVAAVTDLALNLDLEVVAEGIETPETAAVLADLGCQLGQGHYFAMSMAADLLPIWVATRPADGGVGGPWAVPQPAVRPLAAGRALADVDG